MKTSFWRRWLNSIRGTKPTSPITRARPRRALLCLEVLEDRVTPSLTPQMVLDINTNTLGSDPSNMVAIGSTIYFTANDGVRGYELWKSDGTAAGTVLVSSAGGDNLTNVNGTLFFRRYDSTGSGLWKSDGTASGTVLVKDLPPGGNSDLGGLTNGNGTVFFQAYDVTHGYELWKSDGTAAGTVLVKDINTGAAGSYPRNLTNVNGTLFFTADDGVHGQELWQSDGTTAGTVLVKDISPSGGSSSPNSLTNVNGTLFFGADDGAHGQELWKSTGTAAGTVLVKDVNPGSDWSSPSNLTNVNGTLFFSAFSSTGRELWKSDGTVSGTVLVKDISLNGGSYPSSLTNVNGTLFFAAGDDTTFNELWKSDGTADGTMLVKDINPDSAGSSYPLSLTNVNGTLYFTVWYGNVNGTPSFRPSPELWKSDGTEAGTVLVKDFSRADSSGSRPTSLTNVNGTLMFAADDARHGAELWKSDGTTAGTTLIKDINTINTSSSPRYMTDVNGTTFFSADDGVHGRELWKSDGTVAGTTLVKDIFPGGGWNGNWYYGYAYQVNSSNPSNLTNVNGTLFFTVWSAGTGEQLWKSDGTEAGTVLVSGVTAGNLTNVNGTLFFTAGSTWPGNDGYELWKSDGTAAGTVMVKDINPGTHREYGYYRGYYNVPNSSYPGGLTDVNGTLFFTADDGVHGRELWQSDGTEAGTVLVKDVKPGSASSYLGDLTDVNGKLFFTADDGVHGRELWTSDGTTAGTVLVKEILSGSASSSPGNLTDVNGTLFFSASNGPNSYDLWKSDGTAAGTVMVKDIDPGTHRVFGYSGWGYTYAPNGSALSNLTAVNGKLFFAADDGHGVELWTSDGTEAGTTFVKDIYPGSHWVFYSRGPYLDGFSAYLPNSSVPSNLTNVNDLLFFTANDGTGAKLWESDGTEAGTVLVANGYPSNLTNVDGKLFFSAYDGVHGQELWMVVDDGAPAPPPSPTVRVNDVTVTEGNTGTRAATFTVTLSAASTEPVTVAYATANGSATAGSDYQAISGTLTFAAGETSKTITVLVNGDRLGEPNETFFVNLSSPTNATIADGQGVGTIVDDEPLVSIGDVTVTEGNTGTRAATFIVTLSVASDQAVTVAYATYDGSYATSSDYQATSGTLTIPAGQTSGTITVLVKGDRLPEPDESFVVELSSPTNAMIADGQGVGIIVDDEPRVSISDVTKAEGKKNQTTQFTFTVTLSAAYDQAVMMSYRTVNGTATTGNNDYVAKSGTLTFAPGETTKTITIDVKGDSKKEANETFYLDLFGNSSNSLVTKGRGIGTILNDD